MVALIQIIGKDLINGVLIGVLVFFLVIAILSKSIKISVEALGYAIIGVFSLLWVPVKIIFDFFDYIFIRYFPRTQSTQESYQQPEQTDLEKIHKFIHRSELTYNSYKVNPLNQLLDAPILQMENVFGSSSKALHSIVWLSKDFISPPQSQNYGWSLYDEVIVEFSPKTVNFIDSKKLVLKSSFKYYCARLLDLENS